MSDMSSDEYILSELPFTKKKKKIPLAKRRFTDFEQVMESSSQDFSAEERSDGLNRNYDQSDSNSDYSEESASEESDSSSYSPDDKENSYSDSYSGAVLPKAAPKSENFHDQSRNPSKKLAKSKSSVFDNDKAERIARSCGFFNGLPESPVSLRKPLLLQDADEDPKFGFRFEPDFEPGSSDISINIPGFTPEQQFDKLLRFSNNQTFAFTDEPRLQYKLSLPAANHIGSPEVEPTLLPTCALCKEPCKERCYFAHGNSYHPLCFKCSKCHRHLRPPNCTFMMEQPYCHFCSCQQNNLHRCIVCGLYVLDPRDEIQPDCYDSPIHRTCLRCHVCSEGIGIDDYTLVSGKPVCKKCISDLSNKICKKCGKVIIERSVEFHGNHYHPEHFVCTQCNIPLRGQNYVVYRNRPYCPTHGDAYATRKCWACHGDFNDEDVIRWDGRAYHSDCFKCKICQIKLTQDNWIRVHGYPYCEKCYKKYRDDKAAKFESKIKEKRKPVRRLKRMRKDIP
ncbi:hypothetical protein TRFO_18835 [Tritrichomonas foetus]|uniref:LIM zinc-binding domain-containing protein n=1 Tax=Tritrichomonas foetus TaxID=1144522 RepID=A0A1J4KJV8_9EUKA|nr:hypothetical protein TRFO_18835 [Tritrichomonas foetus]|eukprot:OHT11591.1 hypothetical protein TRFO_18835 [Tritrichomonas foetus]